MSTAFTPSDGSAHEDAMLAPYAMRSRLSRGRRHEEESHPFRTLYQRDRERIVHSTAFRRLMHKTQVIVAQTNDHHRTRLTHTLEVAQISRTIARRLGLHEDLTEAIALSHDLGHPPFGHAGEDMLDECLRQHGGFDHNVHALRVVEELEERYPNFRGLNLSWEVREAFVHHAKRRDAVVCAEYLAVGGPLLEAQVVDAADSLTYDTHDIDDALGLGLIGFEDLAGVAFWKEAFDQVWKRDVPAEIVRTGVIRLLIDWQVRDLIEHTQRQMRENRIETIEDVRRVETPLAGCSPAVEPLKAELESFLHERVYRHYRVMGMKHKGRRILKDLFREFVARPELLPDHYTRRRQHDPLERVAGDYLAGMTDRFAQQEHLRLFHPFADV